MMLLEHIGDEIGLDEAGRGPLAGPVVAAAAWLPAGFDLQGLDDSKRLNKSQRTELESRLKTVPHAIVSISSEEIDRINILEASLLAMTLACEQLERMLPSSPRRILVDGNRLPAKLKDRAEAVIKGDGRFACIAAASILAKTERDRVMTEQAEIFPEYGFEIHFGYPTQRHLKALKSHGPCPIHRRSYAPVAKLTSQPELLTDQ